MLLVYLFYVAYARACGAGLLVDGESRVPRRAVDASSAVVGLDGEVWRRELAASLTTERRPAAGPVYTHPGLSTHPRSLPLFPYSSTVTHRPLSVSLVPAGMSSTSSSGSYTTVMTKLHD